ncbi:hypothetical protein [Streptomyces sp. ICC1]|uniref:hypothetical protein n=1 Tax=Streptomyces sp. ICC1 TaxID=2099583 RepID=UPI000DC7B276|nr:hypothetical protein [Streptomyces sp. ICC1]AWZ14053.1 hypothetical protein DRB96_19185 [Streptomyces sp. ICC1]
MRTHAPRSVQGGSSATSDGYKRHAHGAPTHAAPAQPPYPQPSYPQPSYPQPVYTQPSYPQPGYAQPAYTQAPYPQTPYAQPSHPPAAGRKRTGLIVAGAIAASLVGLVVLGSLLPDGKGGKGGDAKDPGGAGAGASSGAAKRPEPQPVSYQGIDVPQNHQLLFADNPPRPAEEPTGAGVLYGHGDLFYYRDTLFGDERFGTANGKLVLLNNSEKGSLETCRAVTRFTEKIGLDQLTDGSQVCVLSDAGHVALVTYRGRSGAKESSTYIKVDLTIWRNAGDAKKN